VLEYLYSLFEENMEYSTIAAHRSAISANHNLVDGNPVGMHPDVSKLIKGVDKLRPKKPKYCSTWNVDQVLSFILTLGDNQSMSLMDLSQKTVFLLAITSVHRGKEIHSLKLHLMSANTEFTSFRFDVKFKTTKQGELPPDTIFHRFKENCKLCPVEALNALISRTLQFRASETKGMWKPDRVFLRTIEPHNEVTKPTIATWLVKIINRAGIDLHSHNSQASKKYASHSTRAAASSKAAKLGLPIEDIVKYANWSQRSTFEKFYHKPIDHKGKKFQSTILKIT
jgi:hypothetical protein